MAKPTDPEKPMTADQIVRKMVAKANMLKDYSYTPKNVVLITVDDIVEITRVIVPYTMKRLDEAYDKSVDVRTRAPKRVQLEKQIREIIKAPMRSTISTRDIAVGFMSTTLLNEKVHDLMQLIEQEITKD